MDNKQYNFQDLVDIDKLKVLFGEFTDATGFTTGLVDQTTNEVLVSTGWRDICSKFHRVFPASEAHCKASNKELTQGLNTLGEIRISHCMNGLVDGSTPILIEGRHLATLFTGQVAFSPPDINHFKKQAIEYGFDEEHYLNALEKVPVVSEKKFTAMLRFLAHLATTVAEIGLANLHSRRDLAKRKVTEQKLATEHEKLLVTLRSIGDGVIATDINGNIIMINKVAESLTGWEQEEAIGQSIEKVFVIVNECDGKSTCSPVKKVLETGRFVGWERDTSLIAKGGISRNIADSGAPIRNQENIIVGVVLVFRDVTEQLQMEKELLKASKLESVGLLAGGIAHDFNNILAAILGNIDLANQFISREHKAYVLLNAAYKASLRARDLTQQLLTFSKGGEPIKKVALIGKVIEDSAEFVLRGSSIACHYDIPTDLWLVDIDVGQISQVIQNLVINARHAMSEGGMIDIVCTNIPDIEKEMALLLPQKAFVKITVQDYGVGIPEKYNEKIFDPYFSTKQEGSGLGLATSHSIIEQHNGHISVQSTLGEGTTFTIYLPASANTSIEEDVQETIFRKIPGKIMVVDDDKAVQDVAKSMLEHHDYEVVLAGDGVDAIKLYQNLQQTKTPIDVIIIDLTIPGGMGGKETIVGLLNIDPQVKVIVSSGYSTDPVMANYQKYGFKGFVAKPYNLAELGIVINNVLKDDF